MMKNVADQMNTCIRNAENANKLLNIQNRFSDGCVRF
jgi:hypothetical protein